MLWRETLIHKRLKEILDNEEVSENIKNLITLCNVLTETQEILQEALCNLKKDKDIKHITRRVK